MIDGGIQHIDLDNAVQRESYMEEVGNAYVERLEGIRDTLNSEAGTTLGAMIKAQLEMVHAETEYLVSSGIPKKIASSVNQAAQEVKKAAG